MIRQTAISVFLAVLLSACGSTRSCDKHQPYLEARPGPDLRVPDDLDELRASGRAEIPEASRQQLERGPDDPCLDFPPVLRSGDDE